MKNGGEASPSIILVGRALLVKMLITLNLMECFHQILLAYTVLHCLDNDIQNKNKASPSIIVAGHG